jgi:hypothetical protein
LALKFKEIHDDNDDNFAILKKWGMILYYYGYDC